MPDETVPKTELSESDYEAMLHHVRHGLIPAALLDTVVVRRTAPPASPQNTVDRWPELNPRR